ncbi:hypothetical protein D3C87_504930 [compost metagenome]
MSDYPFIHKESENDPLLQSLIDASEQSYSLHITDRQNNLVKLGSIAVTGPNKVRVLLTPQAEPFIGNLLGASFSSLVNTSTELRISPLRLANVLGLNINNTTLMQHKFGALYTNIELNDVFKLAKQYKSDIMITDNDIEAEKGITVISWNAVYASQIHADNYFAQRDRMKESEPMYLRDKGQQLVAADVLCAANDGGEQARALIHQHAVHSALSDLDFPTVRTELIRSSDGQRLMLLKQREGAVPFAPVVTASRDFQTLTRNLHKGGGFCSIDRLQNMISGSIEQLFDPSARLMSYMMNKPAIISQIAPVLIYQKLSGMMPNSGNDIGVLLDSQNGKRVMQAAYSFNANPAKGMAEPGHEVGIDELLSMPAIKMIADEHPAEFETALGKAGLISSSVKIHLAALEKKGFQISNPDVEASQARHLSISSPFTKNDALMQAYFERREKVNGGLNR